MLTTSKLITILEFTKFDLTIMKFMRAIMNIFATSVYSSIEVNALYYTK